MGIRLCGDELILGGLTFDDVREIARRLEATGQLDYINTSIGEFHNLYMVEGSMHTPPGYQLFISSGLREVVKLPVFCTGRIKDPVQAERILREGLADMVGVVRGQICDPEFTRKARQGRTESIRLCISCNQYCLGRMGLSLSLGCIQTPATGNELRFTRPVPVNADAISRGTPPLSDVGFFVRSLRERLEREGQGTPLKPRQGRLSLDPAGNNPDLKGTPTGGQVSTPHGAGTKDQVKRPLLMVVGGGPAGMQAAKVAAQRGFHVRLYEQQRELGGQINLIVQGPNRVEFGDVSRNLQREILEAGVKVRLGIEVTAALIEQEQPDAVIIATGSRPSLPPTPGADLPHVATVWQVLQKEKLAQTGEYVLVYDQLGFHQATSVAELLAERGCLVEVVTPQFYVGGDLSVTLDIELW